jgi:hypothetical protein
MAVCSVPALYARPEKTPAANTPALAARTLRLVNINRFSFVWK